MPLGPDAAFGRLGATLVERLPDIAGKVSGLTRIEDAFNRLEHGCGRQQPQSGDMPELVQLEAVDGEVGLGGVVDNLLGFRVGAAGRTFAGEAGGPLIGESWLLVWK